MTVNMTVDMTVQMMMIPRSGLTPPPRFLSMKNDTGAQVVTSELSCLSVAGTIMVTRYIQLLDAE